MNQTPTYLDPAVLARIGRLDLMARSVVEGFLAGRHRSPFQGSAVEFASHREYADGDDPRRIDWKVYARTDRLYVRQYEEETNLQATFLVDASESMRYRPAGGDRLTKYQYAACAAASVSMLLLNQQDAAAVATFDEQFREFVDASSKTSHIQRIIHALDSATPAGKTSVAGVCRSLVEKIPRRGLVCLISDLFCEIDGIDEGLQLLRDRGHEAMVMHVMDEDELTFPFQQNTRFEGLEGAGSVTARPRSLREEYLRQVRRFCDEVRRVCIARGVDYQRISTADNLGAALSSFLAARAAAKTKRINRPR